MIGGDVVAGSFVYVSNAVDGTIGAYAMNPDSGALTAIATVAAGQQGILETKYGSFASGADVSQETRPFSWWGPTRMGIFGHPMLRAWP